MNELELYQMRVRMNYQSASEEQKEREKIVMFMQS